MRSLSFATIFVAAAGFVILSIASYSLSPGVNATFLGFWSLFFALTGVADGLMHETARGVTVAHSEGSTPHSTLPFLLTIPIALIAGILAIGSSFLWAPLLVPQHPVWSAFLLAVGLMSYCFQATLCGIYSATAMWIPFSWLITIDSASRLLLAAIAYLMGWELLAFLIMTVFGALSWLFFLIHGASRRVLLIRTDVSASAFLSRSLTAMLASGANALIITGFPMLMILTNPAELPRSAINATVLAVTLTRAPLLVPLQRFQPALIVHFTKNRHRVLQAALLPMGITLGVAVFGALLAWFIGPPIFDLYTGTKGAITGTTLAYLTLASAATALLMISSSAVLAANNHKLYLAGWIAATVTAIALLTVDTSPEWRAILSLGLGPCVGIILQLYVLTQLSPKSSTSSSPAAHSPTTSIPEQRKEKL